MKQVFISKKVLKILDLYIESYLDYYENLYLDTGIFGIEEIKNFYIKESMIRRKEIITLIISKFSDSLIVYSNKKAVIKWRSKYLIIKFEDNDGKRIISDLEIR